MLNVKNRSHAVTAQVTLPEGGTSGVIIAQGGAFGGWSLYANDGRLVYCHNFLGLQRFKVAADSALSPGTHTVRMEFAYDGGGMGKGGMGKLFLDDEKVGEARIERTQPMIFSADETADVGIDLATPVVASIGSKSQSRFTGRIHQVTVAVQ